MSTTANPFDTETIPGCCCDCGKAFDAFVLFGVPAPRCDDCVTIAIDAAKVAEAEQRRKERENAFNLRMPPIMRETDPNHPRFPAARWAKVDSWRYGARGLILHGVSRTGKSRCLWRLLRRVYVHDGLDVLVYGPGQLERAVASSYAHTGGAEAFFARVVNAPVLAIDDFGKERFTDRFESFVFSALNERFEWQRPVILSTNFVGGALVDRFDDKEKGFPLVERLREFCEAVSFA